MQVITINSPGLEWQAKCLAEKVKKGHPARFDAIVAVRRGGSFVSEAFRKYYPRENYGERFEIDLHRPSTHYKKGKLVRMLPHVPLWILNTMRLSEARLLKATQLVFPRREPPKVTLEPELVGLLKSKATPEVLLIDDAIDSGITLWGISEAIKAVNPSTKITTMAITVTTREPKVMADYFMYNNSTLVRFPWSKDFKNR